MAAESVTILEIDGVEMDRVEWSVDPEEVLGGIGRCTVMLQDRTNSWEPVQHADVKLSIRDSGWVLFRGEIEKTPVELKTGHPWRTWKLDCADYNIELGRRLVGALDGNTWMDPSGLGFFINIDPFATTLKTDKLTVQQLFDHYIRVAGEAFETDTYVNEYLDDIFPITWDYKYLSETLDDLASMIVDNLQYWIDPDLFVHWVTIPAWQDLAQDVIDTSTDDAVATLGSMMPEFSSDQVVLAPADASDISDEPGHVGFSKLEFDFDGSNMPQQVYVRGGTGFVYNAPAIDPTDETKTVVKAPITGAPGTYELTITTTTKLWHVDSTGYVSVTFASVGAGGPWPVKWVSVPWNASRNKGGNYWKFLAGPHVGLLADDNTNYLNGYGHITVVKVTAGAPGDPKVGIGGSGWAGDVAQDRNKRQAFLEASVSTTKSLRDSIGGQSVYRGLFPTLRGSVEVTGIDGWRVGQLLKITDSRLPDVLNGRYFIIQRVKSQLITATNVRRYTLDWGDGPENRYSADDHRGGPVEWPPPVIQIDVTVQDLSPGPNSTQTVTGQLIDGAGKSWGISGKTVDWSFECYDRLGVLQTGEGSISPTVSITDKNGRARTRLTTGADVNLVYFVFADVKVT